MYIYIYNVGSSSRTARAAAAPRSGGTPGGTRAPDDT